MPWRNEMVSLLDIDLDSGCDDGAVVIHDDGVDEVAEYFAAMANKHNDNDWWEESQQIARIAVYTALSNPGLIAKLHKQYTEEMK